MKNILRTILALCFFQGAVWAQEPVPGPRPSPPPRSDDSIRPTSGVITGTIRMIDCNAVLGDVRVTAGGQTARLTIPEDNAFVWRFSVSVAPGTHTVLPELLPSRCVGGAWTPISRTVSVVRAGTATVGEFTYRGRRVTTRLGGIVIASLIGSAFEGMAIHLNNYNPEPHRFEGRDSWHVPNVSFIQMPTRRGVRGAITNFTLLEMSQGPLRYYVRDLDLQRISSRAERGSFLVSLFFEDAGPTEIKGHCSNTTRSIDVACPAGSDSTAPDFEIDQARVDIRLTPARGVGGSLTYGPVRVTFDADVRGAGLGSFVETQVKREIKREVERMVMDIVDQPAMRAAVAEELAPQLRLAGIGDVTNVRMDGRDVVIESYPR